MRGIGITRARTVLEILAALGVDAPVLRQQRKVVPYMPLSRPLSMDRYFVDGHGSVRRRVQKRDKSMSARQWKKLVKRERRIARVAALSAAMEAAR